MKTTLSFMYLLVLTFICLLKCGASQNQNLPNSSFVTFTRNDVINTSTDREESVEMSFRNSNNQKLDLLNFLGQLYIFLLVSTFFSIGVSMLICYLISLSIFLSDLSMFEYFIARLCGFSLIYSASYYICFRILNKCF
ncbi:hypothetical protein NGRA_0440 [Nosema granulosis]|uniref:Transmembrane protein n=1 Tax=Nosema granulosis TaxID=83296 RepID=A0A9P6H0C0_9MICR|nr:hypothetical protein NGRA_0440 [Nosema granulosis]